MSSLLAISPVDGRYLKKTKALQKYFSEFALIKYRIKVEVEYFIALMDAGIVYVKSPDHVALRSLYESFDLQEAERIKEIENTTNHDVKAVEYYLKDRMSQLGLTKQVEFIHFGLTSQDINNVAIPLALKEAMTENLQASLNSVVSILRSREDEWKDIAMLSRTHGQPASPTLLGKEIAVFRKRLEIQLNDLEKIPFTAKFGGATGNFNAHYAAFPDVNWHAFASQFVETRLGLMRSYPTTQIEHYDQLAALFDALKRINTILIDLCRDIWHYVSIEYFTQQTIKGEIGSSAMPHKVNPIDFENAEGNLGLANALFEFLSSKLPVSRLQRDLTDSTVLRNIGVPLAHTLISLSSIEKGLNKLQINQNAIARDLENNWIVVAEAIQTILRREGYPQPYEALKELTRGQHVTESTIRHFIQSLQVSETIKTELHKITPFNYTGKYFST